METVVHEKVVLGAPFIYITTHGVDNIYKFSRDGNLITDKVLKKSGIMGKTGMRMMAFGEYDDKNKNAMYVTSPEGPYQVAVFGDCKKEKSALGQREPLALLVNRNHTPGAVHGYGIAIDPNAALYVSFQDTDSVLRFDPKNNFFPFANFLPDIRKLKRMNRLY
jgi:hypothetical protein